MAAIALMTAQLACIIALQTMALIIWNVGARDPVGFVRDVVSVRDAKTALYGIASLTIGLMFIAAATMLIISAVSPVPHLFIGTAMSTFLIAISIDALIGNELRKAARLQ